MFIIKKREDNKYEIKKEGNKRASEITNSLDEAINYCKKRNLEYKIETDIVTKAIKKHGFKKTFIILFILILIILGIFLGLYFTNNLGFLSKNNNKNNNHTSLPGKIEDANFSIHFLEVGNKYTGDATYIKAGDTDILIDAGSKRSSSTYIKEYIDNYVTDNKLEYVVATHAHEDHISGFVGSNNELGIFDLYEIDTLIDFSLTNSTSALYEDYLEKRETLIESGTNYYNAKEAFNNENGAKNIYSLGEDMSLEILYNKYYFEESSDENNYSVITLIKNKNHNFLLTGDLEAEGEESFVKYYENNKDKKIPEVDVFKAGHHGSKTSSNEKLLEMIKPKAVSVCCCAGSTQYTSNYLNVFPTQNFIDRISKYTDNVYVTTVLNEKTKEHESLNGTIIFESNGLELGMTGTNNSTILKDTSWFNEKIYVDKDNNISSGKGKDDFFISTTPNVKEVVRRIWPQ